MSIQLSNAAYFCRKRSQFRNSRFSPVSASLETGLERVAAAKSTSMCFEETRERISKLIQKPEISVSSYDTAWVAMVPASHSTEEPCFPNCVNWLLENQCNDGSWARPHHHSFLQKDVLSSTLACILALKRWGLGGDQINRGIHFIESNFASATEKDQISPMGFDIIFGGMLEYARDLALDLNLESKSLNGLIHKRNLELKRWYESYSTDMEADMAYLSEGIGKLQDWHSVMKKYQRRNGSLFNSPSTTSAACIFHHNDNCLDYLHSAMKTFGNAVPAIYPLNVNVRLHTIENLERLGISQHFKKEIQDVLNEIYRGWLQGEEEIFMDASACALAFRILRVNGYDVTSDEINEVLERERLSSFLGGHTRDVHKTLDLYKASEIIFPSEAALEKHNLWLKHSLEQGLLSGLGYSSELGRNIGKEVKHALQYPSHAIMERVANRRNIAQYNLDNTRIMKTSFCSPNFGNKDFLFMSVTDFNKCQTMHQEELKEIQRWVTENRLDELKFARQKSTFCYFSTAATFYSPELSEARMSWAKSGYLVTVVDDFFDDKGSLEELDNLIQLVEAWDVDACTVSSSEDVLIIFSALKSTITDIADKASVRQERNVKKHMIDIWLKLLYSELKEMKWVIDGYTPTMGEYMSNGYVSSGLGTVVPPALYLVGPKLSHDTVHHPDYNNLIKLVCTLCRLLNDIHEKESKQNKKSAVTLYMMNGGGGDITEQLAIAEIKKLIDFNRRELHRLVLDEKNSVLTRACKDLFWHMSTILHQIYFKDDAYRSEGLTGTLNSIMYEPIVLDEC